MSSKKKAEESSKSKKKEEDTAMKKFPRTRARLNSMYNMFLCIKCSKVPKEELFMLGGCDHKYCEACKDVYAGKACAICGKESDIEEVVADRLSCTFLKKLRIVEKSFLEEIQESQSKDDDKKKNKKESNKKNDEDLKTGKGNKIKPAVATDTAEDQDLKISRGKKKNVVKGSEDIFDFRAEEDGEESGTPAKVKPKKETKGDTTKKKESTKEKEKAVKQDSKDTGADSKAETRKKKTEIEEKGAQRKKDNKAVVPENDVSVLSEKNEQADEDFKAKKKDNDNSVKNDSSRPDRKRKLGAVDEDTHQQKKTTGEKKLKPEATEVTPPNSPKRAPAISNIRKRGGKSTHSPEITELCSTPVKTKGLKRKRNPSAVSGSSVASSNRSHVPKNSPATPANELTTSPSWANTSFSSSCPVDKRNAKGETQLHVACRSGLLEKVKQLVETGADLNAQDYAGWTPLHEAITGKGTNKLELVSYLCEQKCNTNVPGMDNEFALHEAARAGLEDIIDCLLCHSASPNVRNKKGQLPRDVADNEAIKALLDDGNGNESLNVSMTEDPVVLQLQFAKALLFFAYDVPDKERLGIEAMNLRVSKMLKGDVTHIIFDVQEKERAKGKDQPREISYSPEFLQGMANGMWMIHKEWIDKCIATKKLLSPRDYEVQGCYSVKDAPAKARVNKEVGNPGLLNGFSFYLYKTCAYEGFNKQQLSKLITAAEGKVINREPRPDLVDPLESPIRFHAKEDNHKFVLTSHVILYGDKDVPPQEKKLNMEHIKTLHVKWLIESIGSFSLLNPESYL